MITNWNKQVWILLLVGILLSGYKCGMTDNAAGRPNEIVDGDLDIPDSSEGEHDFSDDSIVDGDAEGDYVERPSLDSFYYLRVVPFHERQGQFFQLEKPLPDTIEIDMLPLYTANINIYSEIEGLGGEVIFSPIQPENLPTALRIDPVVFKMQPGNTSFSIQLLGHTSYDVLINLESKNIPPYLAPYGLVLDSDNLDMGYELYVSDLTVTGRLQASSPQQVAGLMVRARSGSYQSTKGIVFQQGSFTITLPKLDIRPSQPVYFTLEVEGRTSERPFVPKRIFENVIEVKKKENGDYKIRYKNPDTGEYTDELLLDYEKIYVGACKLEGFIWLSDEEDMVCTQTSDKCHPLTNGSVSFKANLPNGSFSKSVVLNEDKFSVELYPAIYDVEIIPAMNSAAASAKVSMDCRPNIYENPDGRHDFTMVFEHTLYHKKSLYGQIIAYDSGVMKDATIEAWYLEKNGLDSTLLYTTNSEADGAYKLLLDPGIYRIYIKPPAEFSTMAWTMFEDFTITEDTERDFLLYKGIEIQGFLKRDGAQLQTQALIELYKINSDGEAEVIYSTNSDEKGKFILVLPE